MGIAVDQSQETAILEGFVEFMLVAATLMQYGWLRRRDQILGVFVFWGWVIRCPIGAPGTSNGFSRRIGLVIAMLGNANTEG